MLILENNYKKQDSIRDITCHNCNSKLRYTNEDVHENAGDKFIICEACNSRIFITEIDIDIVPDFLPPYYCEKCYHNFDTPYYIGAGGHIYAKCPLCGNEEYIGEGIEITEQNIEYPKHFYSNDNAVEIDNHTINQWIKDCIKHLSEENNYYFTSCGDTYILAYMDDLDSDYANIVVAKQYKETIIKIHRENN